MSGNIVSNNEHFKATAAQYDEDPFWHSFSAFVLSSLETRAWFTEAMGHSMDLGCGTGVLSLALEGRCTSVVGVDVSPDMLQVLKRKVQDRGLAGKVSTTTFDVLSDDTLPDVLRNRRFDFIFSQLAFHHIKDGAGMVRRLVDRYLAPGGRLLVVDFGHSENSHLFHHKEMVLGSDYEYDGISDEQAMAWFDNASWRSVEISKFPFEEPPAPGHDDDAFVIANPGKPVTHNLMVITATKTKAKTKSTGGSECSLASAQQQELDARAEAWLQQTELEADQLLGLGDEQPRKKTRRSPNPTTATTIPS